MAVEIIRSATCAAPLSVAFDYVADYRNISKWMFGIERFEPAGEQDYGKDAEFDVTAKLGVRVHSRLKAVEWVHHRLIGMDTVKGFDFRSRFSFEPSGEDITTVTAHVTYRLPGGPAGKAMGKVMEPVVKRAVDHANRTLVHNIEQAAAR